jgi:hypothetical protein
MTNQALTNKASSGTSSSPKNEEFIVRVTDINLDPSLGYTKIGSISGEKISGKGILTGRIYKDIRPSDPYKKSFPLVNEFVRVRYVVAPNSTGGQFVYEGPISLYGAVSPNVNPSPSPLSNPLPLSQQVNYSQVEAGAYNIQNNTPQTLDFNSKNNPDQSTFIEKSNIHPLLPYAGDVIYEGRWGNSIRLGSTAKTTTYPNNWSTSGTNGDPLIILRNGQPDNSSDFGAEPIIEDITKDLSSVYLTSTQKLPIQLAKTTRELISYKVSPTAVNEFISPQIVLNSARVVLNATKDHILISGKQSVGLSSIKSVNIDAPSTIIQSSNIFLGDKGAVEHGVKGDTLYNKLDVILSSLITLVSVLEVQQIWPGGLAAPDGGMLLTASNVKTQLTNTQNTLKQILSDSVKTT